jgi:ATPase subunit of ABC transporter with duplicated ATPase domains
MGKPQIGFAGIPRSNTRPLTVNELEVGYSFALLPKLSFKMAAGEKLAVTGFNGIGKTTLLKTLVGLIPAISGGMILTNGENCLLRAGNPLPNGCMTPTEIIAEAYPKLTQKEVRSRLSRCGVKTANALQPIRHSAVGSSPKLSFAN